MSKNRRKRRTYIDAGDGITIGVSLRGPLDPETEAAFIALARAAAAQMESGTPSAERSPRSSRSVAGTPGRESQADSGSSRLGTDASSTVVASQPLSETEAGAGVATTRRQEVTERGTAVSPSSDGRASQVQVAPDASVSLSGVAGTPGRQNEQEQGDSGESGL